ncbi:MAG: magnesium transporter [Planctomycetota bacterium]|jgi:magnesium transporter
MSWTEQDLNVFSRSLEDPPAHAGQKLALLDASDAAEVVRRLPRHIRHVALLALPAGTAADVLEEPPDDVAAAAVMKMDSGPAAAMVRQMRSDEEADLLQDIGSSHAEAILCKLAPEEAAAARSLTVYEDATAGDMMQTEFIAIAQGMAAGDVAGQLRGRAADYADYPSPYLYVVDRDSKLLGITSLRSLVLCHADTPVATVASTRVVSAATDLPGIDLLRLFRRLHFLAVPVVDENNHLLGVVTQDDALWFAQEEGDEEMLRFAGIAGGDEFRDMPLRQRASQRLSWLSVNVLLNVAAASVIACYQETLQGVIALAVLVPITADMSGCSGNQAVAVSIRELSLDRIRPTNFLWVFRKELTVGFVNGLVLGCLVALAAWLWKGNAILGAVVGGALWVNTLVAVAVGGLVPLGLRRLGKDPAIASSLILTTLPHMCGFLIVLGAASQCTDLLT